MRDVLVEPAGLMVARRTFDEARKLGCSATVKRDATSFSIDSPLLGDLEVAEVPGEAPAPAYGISVLKLTSESCLWLHRGTAVVESSCCQRSLRNVNGL